MSDVRETCEHCGKPIATEEDGEMHYIDPNVGRRRGGFRRACKTGGNCSSFGSGENCGGFDCDGF